MIPHHEIYSITLKKVSWLPLVLHRHNTGLFSKRETMPFSLQNFVKPDIPSGEKKAALRAKKAKSSL